MLCCGLITAGLPHPSTEPAPLFRFMFVLTFSDVLPGLPSDCTQVIAPSLIILPAAKWRALTSDSISGTVGLMRFRSQQSRDGDGSLSGQDPSNAMPVNCEALCELIKEENAIEEVSL